MPTAATLLAYLTATLLILVVPGPSVVFLMTRSVDQGLRAGLIAMLGLETGAFLHVLAATVGLTALLAASETLLAAVRYVGAGYLLYLGVRQLLTRPRTGSEPPPPSPRLFREGMLVDLLNPKTALFFVAFLPQFVDAAQGPAAIQAMVLGLCFVALAVLCDGSYVVLAHRARTLLAGTLQRRLTRAAGVVYIALAGVAAFA